MRHYWVQGAPTELDVLRIVSREDLIVSKLVWVREAGSDMRRRVALARRFYGADVPDAMLVAYSLRE